MNSTNRNILLAGAIAMAFAGGSAMAAGPFPGVVPFDGSGSGAGFTVDNPGFDINDVTAAPCPVGATCMNSTATQASGGMLMREVDTGTERYLQFIVTDVGGPQGDFVYEGIVSAAGDANAIGAKIIMDDSARDFYTEQALYRGTPFGASAANNDLTVDVHQNLSNGFQTFDMQTTATPNQGASLFRNGRLQILQGGTGNMQQFGHTIVAGAAFQTSAGTLTAGSESITFAAGNALSATWIGGTMSGGGPGPAGNHDARPANLRDFGLLIYRTSGNNSPGAGNAGGTPTGIVEPQFTQTVPTQQARAFSLVPGQDSGQMYNLDHGSFVGGAAILASDWDADVFGDNPYP